ncbi:MAG: hypothetical protein ACKOWQ_08010 [Aquirufa sp.]
MTKKIIIRFLVLSSWGILSLLLLNACWSARCPKVTCRVQVEHRHGDRYYRPRQAFSWMYTPRYKHVRTSNYAGAGPNQVETKKAWYKKIIPSRNSNKPRK